jgi:hypothetical protein
MPNWCENTLKVSGNKTDIQKFKELTLVKQEIGSELYFTMNVLYPTPPELLEQTSPVMWRGEETDTEGKLEFEKYVSELQKKYGYTDWYNWRVDKWGTKWDVADTYILDDEDEFISVQYNTAWSPNIEWVRYVAKQFPELTFTLSFEEPGCSFCGVYEVTGEDEDLCEGDLEYRDEDSGRLVEWNSDSDRWMYSDTKEIIDDEDFDAQQYNPFND